MGHSGGGANVLRLDEDDMIHHIDDAFSAQQMVPNTTIRVDRATLRKMKNAEVRNPSTLLHTASCPPTLKMVSQNPIPAVHIAGAHPRVAQPKHPEPVLPHHG